jgi:sigma-E factor negative regulatory protein RseB
MISKVITGLVLLCGLWPAAQAGNISSEQVGEWLERLAKASRTLNYEGTFVYRHGEQLDAVHIIHKADQQGEHERIISLNGVAREVIRNNDQVACVIPETKAVVVDKNLPAARLPSFPDDIKSIARYYDFEFEGYGRVAGRPVRQIMIHPRDNYRYGYRLWLDDAFELLLGSELLDGEGNPIEQVMFTDIRVMENIDEARLKPNIAGKEYKWLIDDENTQDSSSTEMPGWRAENVPGGFELKQNVMQRLPEHTGMVNHLLYSDGLASVSVYIEPLPRNIDVLRGASQMGAVNAFGRVIDDYHVTAVGEVPAGTVKLISSSLQYVKP